MDNPIIIISIIAGIIILLSVILFIVLIYMAINGCVMLFTRNKVGIDGLIGKYVLVDRNYLDELNFDED